MPKYVNHNISKHLTIKFNTSKTTLKISPFFRVNKRYKLLIKLDSASYKYS